MLMNDKIMFDHYYCINPTKTAKIIVHFILQPYHSLALFTYSQMFFINMLDSGHGQVLMISGVDLEA